MTRLLPLMLPLALMTLLVVAPPSTAEAGAAPGDDRAAIEVLRRAAIAQRTVGYSGTQYLSAWNSLRPEVGSASAILEVDHDPGGSTSMWRRGGARVDVGSGPQPSLAADVAPVELIAESYQVVMARPTSVAGRETDVVHAYRADGSQAAAMWLDTETGLMLRRELYEPSGKVVSASSFIEITIQNPGCCSELTRWVAHASQRMTGGSEDYLDQADAGELRAQGWDCPEKFGDGLQLYRVRRHEDTVQLSYSDGLVSMSVFQQRGRIDPDQLGEYEKRNMGGGTVWVDGGTPPRLLWSTGGHVVTVVTDAPQQSVEPVLAELPPVAGDPTKNGWGHRIGRGGKRLISWINPFD